MARAVDWDGFETKFVKIVKTLDERSSSNKKQALCLCKNCGNDFVAIIANVKSLNTKNCGCVREDKLTRHGLSGSRIYQCWADMKSRCDNGKVGYEDISYCEDWKSFENFYQDMAETYEDHLTIDRIDNSGNYSKDNCRWTDATTQMLNRRKPKTNTSSIYRNVTKHTENTFSAKITYKYVTHVVGYYRTEIEAAKAVDEYIIKNNLPHKLNFNQGD